MTAMGNKLSKANQNITLRYLGITSTFLVLIQLVYGLFCVRLNYLQKRDILEQKAKNEVTLLSAVGQEAISKQDIPRLEALTREMSNQVDLLYSVVFNAKGQPISSFVNQNNSTIARLMEAHEANNINIPQLIETVKTQPIVRQIRTPIIVAGKYLGEIRLGYSLETLQRETQQALSVTLMTFLASVLFATVALLLFNRKVATPLQELSQWSYSLATEQLDPPIDLSSQDEIGQLKTTFQNMAEQLQTLKELQMRMVEQEETEKQLQDASRAKSEFLATVSHEIRTPLNAVNGMTGLLLDSQLTLQQQEFVTIIRSSGEVLLTMINNILDFSKIEAQKLELEEHPFELRECIEEALRLFIPQASERKLELAYLIEPQTPNAIIGDVTRLRQILANLLSNAVKFTEAGEVVIYVNATPVPVPESPLKTQEPFYEIRFAVKDTGIGIPSDRIDRLFRSFSQVDASTTRKYGGTGLGLAISQRLSEMMGGKMWVHSTEGKGSTFYFTVFAKEAPSLSPANSQDAGRTLVGKRMLIVDDNVTNQKILTLQAQSWGMFTCAVESGTKALEWLARGASFDIAILDLSMHPVDGLTVAQEIRKQPHCKDLPLVLLSSLGKQDLGRPGKDGRFAAILNKPLQQAQLYNTLLRVFTEKPIKVTAATSTNSAVLAEPFPLRILVAEDVVINQEVTRLLLKKLGYQRADIASNGIEVLQALRRQPYDVILMDVRMPEMDGLTATQRICQEWSPESRPRIIAMTADAMRGDREKCLEAGMDDYLVKPIRLEELRQALSKCKLLPQSPSVDIKILESLRKLAGKRAPVIMADLIQGYLQDAPDRLEAIATAIAQKDAQALRQAAHAFRSASLNLGANQLSNLCQEVEGIGRSGTILGASEKLSEIKTEYEKVDKTLRRELDDL